MNWLLHGAIALLAKTAAGWPYDEAYLDYNLNQNKTATNPADYWGTWPDHQGKYHPSPENWRFPFYSLFLDRFVNGDPSNDNINGTTFEHDLDHRIRHGGDVAGLVDTLDYLQGMGIKVSFICGVSIQRARYSQSLGHLHRGYFIDEPTVDFGRVWSYGHNHA